MHASAGPDRIDRRGFIRGAAGAMVGAGVASTMGGTALAHSGGHDAPLRPTPEPIPGGLPVGLPAPFDLIHIFIPGPEGVVLPFSGLPLMGLDVESSTILDYRGKTALAYLVGSATGSDGESYGVEVDMRVFQGSYVAGGETHEGTFALF